MTNEELVALVRLDTDDLVEPYLSSDAAIIQWLAEAEQEACIRSRLIYDATTPEVCSIAVTAGTSVYPLHESIIDIARIAFTPTGGTAVVLYLTDMVEQDRTHPDWRTTVDVPRQAIHLDTSLRLGCIPSTNGTLALECYRLPTSYADESWAPEIGAIHHRHLAQWALYRCYSRPDPELMNPKKAEIALSEFTRVFGLRPDAGMRRETWANRPQFNKAVW